MGEKRRGRGCFILCATLVIITLAGCLFGPVRYRGVKSYRDGQVFIRHGKTYRVGTLPEGWRGLDTRARVIAFYHPDLHSTIFTDAFCGSSFEDVQSEDLLGRMALGLEHVRILEESPVELDGRGGHMKKLTAHVDGVAHELRLVTVKKGGCVFDFAAVSPLAPAPQVAHDFEIFYRGFHYE